MPGDFPKQRPKVVHGNGLPYGQFTEHGPETTAKKDALQTRDTSHETSQHGDLDREARKRRRLEILAKYQDSEGEKKPHADLDDEKRSSHRISEAEGNLAKDHVVGSIQNAGSNEAVASMSSHKAVAADGEDDKKRYAHLMNEKSKLPSAQKATSISSRLESLTSSAVDLADEEADDFDIFAPAKDLPPVVEAEKNDIKTDIHVPVIRRNVHQNTDDSDGYYLVILGELLDDRYHVFATLGRGMFSTVVKAWDTQTAHGDYKGQEVAVKITRNNEIMYKAGLKEIEILNLLQSQDPTDKKHLVRLERYFEYKGHLCMVFESLALNLREVVKRFGKDLGLSIQAVRAYAQQMFLALGHLRKCGIIHADIKPDNILINENKNVLKICDLGSASDGKGQEITPYLVSRFYRAPEVILGLPCDSSIDTWSIGCTLFELYTGRILFAGRSNNQMLRAMQDCRGKMPHKMIRKGPFGIGTHFDDKFDFISSEIDRITNASSSRMIQYGTIPHPDKDLRTQILPPLPVYKTLPADDKKALLDFVDLLEQLLMLAPERRIAPKDALAHPFLRGMSIRIT